MANIKLSNKQVDSLDFQTEILYKTLDRAIKTGESQDAFLLKETTHVYGNLIQWTTNSKTTNLKGRQFQNNALDNFMLQFVIVDALADYLQMAIAHSEYEPGSIKNTTTGDKYLRDLINNPKIDYNTIKNSVADLAQHQNFTEIMSGLNYVKIRTL